MRVASSTKDDRASTTASPTVDPSIGQYLISLKRLIEGSVPSPPTLARIVVLAIIGVAALLFPIGGPGIAWVIIATTTGLLLLGGAAKQLATLLSESRDTELASIDIKHESDRPTNEQIDPARIASMALVHALELSTNKADISGLLQSGADPNAMGRSGSALALAVRRGNVEHVETLLDAGADANLPSARFVEVGTASSPRLRSAESYVWTPLHAAAERGHLAIARALVAAGAHIDKVIVLDEHRMRPIDLAARSGHAELVRYFLELDPSEAAVRRLFDRPGIFGRRYTEEIERLLEEAWNRIPELQRLMKAGPQEPAAQFAYRWLQERQGFRTHVWRLAHVDGHHFTAESPRTEVVIPNPSLVLGERQIEWIFSGTLPDRSLHLVLPARPGTNIGPHKVEDLLVEHSHIEPERLVYGVRKRWEQFVGEIVYETETYIIQVLGVGTKMLNREEAETAAETLWRQWRDG